MASAVHVRLVLPVVGRGSGETRAGCDHLLRNLQYLCLRLSDCSTPKKHMLPRRREVLGMSKRVVILNQFSLCPDLLVVHGCRQ